MRRNIGIANIQREESCQMNRKIGNGKEKFSRKFFNELGNRGIRKIARFKYLPLYLFLFISNEDTGHAPKSPGLPVDYTIGRTQGQFRCWSIEIGEERERKREREREREREVEILQQLQALCSYHT